jgi:AMMECR1 domain-containing protein
MTDVELVIKIPEETYEYWKNHSHEYVLAEAIKNGIILPSGHGDLIDREELLKLPIDKANYPSNYVKYAQTIIEKDRNKD